MIATEEIEPVLLKLSEIRQQYKIGTTTIYAMMKRNKFPHPIKIGSSSRWVSAEVEAWARALASGRKFNARLPL